MKNSGGEILMIRCCRPLSSTRCSSRLTRFIVVPVFVLLIAQSSQLTVRGQSATATLSGTVEDANGAVVPGANVTVTNEATRLTRQSTTDKEGSFVITLLPPSTYSVTVEAQGFAPLRVP